MSLLAPTVTQEPIILQQLLRCHTRVLIDTQHVTQHLHALIAQVISEQPQTAPLDPSVQLSIRLALEWEVPVQQAEQQDASSPNISRRPIVLNPAYNFRAHIAGSATEHLDLLLRLILCTKTEIDNFDIVICVQNHVFQFYVPVGYTLGVQIS